MKRLISFNGDSNTEFVPFLHFMRIKSFSWKLFWMRVVMRIWKCSSWKATRRRRKIKQNERKFSFCTHHSELNFHSFLCNAHLCSYCQRANTFCHDLRNIQNALRVCPLCTNWRFFLYHSEKEISNILIKWGFSDVSCFFFRVAAAAARAVVVFATTANQTNVPF